MFKKNKILIILVALAAISTISYVADKFLYNSEIIDVRKENDALEASRSTMNLYIFNPKTNDFDLNVIKTNNTFIDEGDYVDELIKSSNFYKNDEQYKFLAAYTLKENNKEVLIIKLSKNFTNLNSDDLKYFVASVKETLKKNFENIDTINIDVDSN